MVKVLYCKLPTIGKQLPAFPLDIATGTEPRPQRWEASVLPPWPPLCRMEQGEVISWSEVEKIDHNQGQKLSDKSQNTVKTFPCVYFNKNVCLHKSSNETRGVFYKHVCYPCFAKEGKAFCPFVQKCQYLTKVQLKHVFNKALVFMHRYLCNHMLKITTVRLSHMNSILLSAL